MMREFYFCLSLCALCFGVTDSARVLCFTSFPSVSHQNALRPLWKALAAKGHEVVVFTPNPIDDKTLKYLSEIDLSSSYELVRTSPLFKTISLSGTTHLSHTQVHNSLYNLTSHLFEYQMSLPRVKNFFKDESRKFDLLIVQAFFLPELYGLAHKYKAPVIGISSFGLLLQSHDSVGNPSHPIAHPDMYLNYGSGLNFWQRWYSVYYSISYRMNYYYNVMPKADVVARKYFGEDMPYLLDLERNASMMFMYRDPILHAPRPNVPAIVELKMMHVEATKPLPKVNE